MSETSELRQRLREAATMTLDVREALAAMSEAELIAVRGQIEEERRDVDAELRLIDKALRLQATLREPSPVASRTA